MNKSTYLAFSLLAGVMTLAALPAQAYVVTTSAGFTTSTAGAVTFADFDLPVTVDPAYATITGGGLGSGADPGAGGQWIAGANGNPVTVTLTGLADYFGLYWGSPMLNNDTVSLYNGATLLFSYLSQEPTPFTPAFFNFSAQNAGEQFDKVVITTQGVCCFEVDNLAVRTAVPEPASLALLGLGLAGLGFSRRRKQQAR